MTVLLCCTQSGGLLPPQLVYAGKTEHCYPTTSFLDGWNITHSTNHWSTEQTMMEFLDKILVPYVKQNRERMQLSSTFPAVAIFDVFAAHRYLGSLTLKTFEQFLCLQGAQGNYKLLTQL